MRKIININDISEEEKCEGKQPIGFEVRPLNDQSHKDTKIARTQRYHTQMRQNA